MPKKKLTNAQIGEYMRKFFKLNGEPRVTDDFGDHCFFCGEWEVFDAKKVEYRLTHADDCLWKLWKDSQGG